MFSSLSGVRLFLRVTTFDYILGTSWLHSQQISSRLDCSVDMNKTQWKVESHWS